MKTTERHHLKDNPLAIALVQAQAWLGQNQRILLVTIGAIALVGAGVAGYAAWTNRVDNQARAMLAAAMVIEEARVMPPGPPAGTTNDPTAIAGQAPGTYPTEKAKLEAALPKHLAAADAYPSTDSGRTARYHAATSLVSLGRFDEAVTQYDQVIAGGSGVVARMARLGKAEAQLRAGQYDPAIATFKELAEQKDGTLPPDALLFELARAYRLAGKTEDAKKTLNQIVDQHKESPFAAEAKTEIEKMKG
jgi:tetratricopeptide (TPR) repeat protein